MLPNSVEYGTVTGRFMEAIVDGNDADLFPDGIPAVGSVLFTPTVPRVTFNDGVSDPMTLLLQPIQANLDSEGYISSPSGERFIHLVSSHSPHVSPSGFTYRVDIRVGRNRFESFDIDVPSGQVVDLAEVIPILESDRVEKSVIKALYDDAMTAIGEALSSVKGIERIEDDDLDGIATVHYTDGSTDSIQLPTAQTKEG